MHRIFINCCPYFIIHITTHYHNISHWEACSMNKKQPKQKPKPLGEQLTEAKIIKLALQNKILFEGNAKIQQYDAKSANLDRLKKILNEEVNYQIKQQEIQEFFTPPSRDVGFDVGRIDQSVMKEIKQFKDKEFYQQVMYKDQSSFFAPNYQQIMLASEQPLTHSILQIKQSYQKQAIRVFNIILSLGKQTSISKQFQQTQILINCLHGARQQIINQSFMQLLKQSNNHLQHSSIKILQQIPVFLHIFTPSKHFLLFSVFFLLSLSKSPHSTQKLQKYLLYSISKIVNKYQHRQGSSYTLSFKPIKHQIISLLCRKVLTIPVYLPMGSHVYIQVQEYDTFRDLKARALKEFGINASGGGRIMDELWGCFEILNVNNQKIEENYLEDDGNVWDVETYWRKANQKYRETGVQHAMFFIMIKIKIGFQCPFEDEQGVEILFSQCFYEYFTGKIILELKQMCILAACLKKLKFSNNQDYRHLFPIWAIKKFSEAQLLQKISQNIKRFQSQLFQDLSLKHLFISLCSKSPICLALALPAQSSPSTSQIFVSPKALIVTSPCSPQQPPRQVRVSQIKIFHYQQNKFMYTLFSSFKQQFIKTENAKNCYDHLVEIFRLGKRGHGQDADREESLNYF